MKFNKENKTVTGYIIIGICFIIFCVLVASALALRQEPTDSVTLCQDEVLAHTIIVLDKTDLLSDSQQRFILGYVNTVKENLNSFEKFSVFTLTENSYLYPEPIFSKCSPGTGKKVNKLYQNLRKIQIRFEEMFSKPLKDNMANILSDNKGLASPILEMIKELSLREDFGSEVPNRTLIMISDMMHHTSEYSHYRNEVSYHRFSRRSYAGDLATRLNSVNVKIVYLVRDNLASIQGKNHLSFWEDYFKNMGASMSLVRGVR